MAAQLNEAVTPVHHADPDVRRGKDVIILIGRPETKTWWRNFRTDSDIGISIEPHWLPMTARVDPFEITSLEDDNNRRVVFNVDETTVAAVMTGYTRDLIGLVSE